MTVVVGLDLSLTATGYCASYGARLLKPVKGVDGLARLRWIRDGVDWVLSGAARQDFAEGGDGEVLVVIEGLAFASLTGKASERAGLWWMVRDMVDDRMMAVVTPTGRAKYATGKGNAPKDTVMLEAAKRFPDMEITDNNTADAAILYAMGCDWLGRPVAPMPAAHRVALDAVSWPARPTEENR